MAGQFQSIVVAQNARVSQTQGLHLSKHALLVLVALLAPAQLGQNMGLYLLLSAAFSSSLLPLSGFDLTKLSSSVVTKAFGCVDRTEARQEGQVYGCMHVAVDAWKANHSFRQAPQKVWRQSSSVSGW
jgi:hypothetical protein